MCVVSENNTAVADNIITVNIHTYKQTFNVFPSRQAYLSACHDRALYDINARRTTKNTRTEIMIIAYLILPQNEPHWSNTRYLTQNAPHRSNIKYPSWFYLLSTTCRERKRRAMCLSKDLHEIARSHSRCVCPPLVSDRSFSELHAPAGVTLNDIK